MKGLKSAPENENILYALAYHFSKNGQIDKARNVALKLVELYPDNTQYRTFLQQLKAAK